MELSFTLASPDPIAEAYVVVRSTVRQAEERGVATFHHIVGAIHFAGHVTESVAPAPVWNLVPVDLLAAKSAKRYDHPVVATIDTDGSVISLHQTEAEARAFLAEIHDAADLRTKSAPDDKSIASSVRVTAGETGVAFDQTGRLPAHVVAALRDMVFLPALDLGTPVPGVTKINLADFFR